MNSYEFEFVLKFMKHSFMNLQTNSHMNLCTNSCANVTFYGGVRFYLHGQMSRYVDIIKGNILFEII